MPLPGEGGEGAAGAAVVAAELARSVSCAWPATFATLALSTRRPRGLLAAGPERRRGARNGFPAVCPPSTPNLRSAAAEAAAAAAAAGSVANPESKSCPPASPSPWLPQSLPPPRLPRGSAQFQHRLRQGGRAALRLAVGGWASLGGPKRLMEEDAAGRPYQTPACAAPPPPFLPWPRRLNCGEGRKMMVRAPSFFLPPRKGSGTCGRSG